MQIRNKGRKVKRKKTERTGRKVQQKHEKEKGSKGSLFSNGHPCRNLACWFLAGPLRLWEPFVQRAVKS